MIHRKIVMPNGSVMETWEPDPSERLAVACRWCVVGWILPAGAKGCDEWIKCPACNGTCIRSETDAEMAARLAGDVDEYERLQSPES